MGCTYICFCVCWWHFLSHFCACLSWSMSMHTPFCRKSTDLAGRHQHFLHPTLTICQDTHRAGRTSVFGCVLWMQCSFRLFFWHYHRINYYCRMEQVMYNSEQHLFFCRRKKCFHGVGGTNTRCVSSRISKQKYSWILKGKWDGSVLVWLLLSSVSVRPVL